MLNVLFLSVMEEIVIFCKGGGKMDRVGIIDGL